MLTYAPNECVRRNKQLFTSFSRENELDSTAAAAEEEASNGIFHTSSSLSLFNEPFNPNSNNSREIIMMKMLDGHKIMYAAPFCFYVDAHI